MTEHKCPFCNTELSNNKTEEPDWYYCEVNECPIQPVFHEDDLPAVDALNASIKTSDDQKKIEFAEAAHGILEILQYRNLPKKELTIITETLALYPKPEVSDEN